MKLRVLDLFSGIGGFSLGLERTGGFETVAFCEIEPFCQKVLAKHWPGVPCYDDVRTLTAASGIGTVDVICGGYPCQPFSTAGKRAGDKDDRHLWPEVRRLLDEFRPAWFIGENVAGHISLGLDEVLSDLEALNYTARPFVIPACAVDAPHRRDRVWIVANGKINGWRQGEPHSCGSDAGIETREECGLGNDRKVVANTKGNAREFFAGQRQDLRNKFAINGAQGDFIPDVANANAARLQGRKEARNAGSQRQGGNQQPERCLDGQWPTWPVEPDVGGGLDGFSFWLDGLDISESHKLYMTYANATNTRPTEILRTLRDRICPQADEWAVGRSFRVSSQAVLFAYLRQLEKHAANETRLQLEGAEASEKELRSVRNEQEPTSAPRRSECSEQPGVEHSNALQALSRLLALHAEKAWIAYRRTDAATDLGWETGIARVAHGVPNRVDRLKALGNAVVPEIPFRIGCAILEAAA